MKKKSLVALVLAAVMLMAPASAAWSPVDFAGGSLSGIVSDGNDLLVSDVFNKVVWRISGDKVEQAVGQISIPGLDGEPIGKYDDGTLETALFMEPWAMTPFLAGFAITDTDAHVVRYFDDAGVFTAVGNGEAGNKNGTGTSAAFNTPTGLATDSDGKVYIADTGNGAIRVMDTKGKVTTLVSGLVDPSGLCWFDGSLYVAETGRSRICRVTDGKLTVIAGDSEADGTEYTGAYVDGPIANARFDHPQGVAVAKNGTIYVADTGNGAIRKIADGRVSTVAAAQNTPDSIVKPRSILIQGNTLLVTDLLAQTLLTVDLTPVQYSDVPANAWFARPVAIATERGLTGGVGNNQFAPSTSVTRAMFATMLSKLHLNADGSAVIDGAASFTDVPTDSWFGPYVRWAADLGVVSGYGNGAFGPNASITREQMAAILFSYAKSMGYDVSVGEDTNILSFTDADKISSYAFPALQWACGAGLISGYDDGSLRPQGQATRAETAAILIAAMNAFGI